MKPPAVESAGLPPQSRPAEVRAVPARLPTVAVAATSLLVAIGTWRPCRAQSALAPDEAQRHFRVADGLAVKLFAAEPLVRQPVTMTFDDRGRLWVIQYLQYPTPAGLKPVEVDQYLRTKYDRRPEPPPKGPHGADRITILEDTDGDGRADRAKDFVTGLNLASALAIGNGGVYVGQAPYLLFYPDRNGDDVPDGDPEVLLTGFGMEDAHAVVNSLVWGPDGWLYGAQGSTVTADIRGVGFQQGIWRSIRRPKSSSCLPKGAGTPGASTSTGTAMCWPARISAARCCCTRCRGAITSKVSPSTARCTILTPTAISSTLRTRAGAAATSPAAASIIKAPGWASVLPIRISPPICSRMPSTGTRSSPRVRRSRPGTPANCSQPTTSGSGRSTVWPAPTGHCGLPIGTTCGRTTSFRKTLGTNPTAAFGVSSGRGLSRRRRANWPNARVTSS